MTHRPREGLQGWFSLVAFTEVSPTDRAGGGSRGLSIGVGYRATIL